MSAAATMHMPREGSNYDEISMQQSLLFSDCLKDLKNLRTQLYSAAEYFELSYTNDGDTQSVVETLKDYAIKALVNTVDHLGSVTYKVNDFVDEKVDQVAGTELRVACIEQRLRMCQEFMDHEGRSQQSLVINTPKFHKRYILPSGEIKKGGNLAKLKSVESSFGDEADWNQFRNTVRTTIRETPPPPLRRPVLPSPPPQRKTQRSATFSFSSISNTAPKKEQDKRAVSPHRFPLLRSGSVAIRPTSVSRPTTPSKSRTITPKRYPSEPRRSASVRVAFEKEAQKEPEQQQQHQQPSKSRRLLKALLSRRKTKKDDTLYTYLDEY
ncbi:Protein ABIL3 [Raphanus sativus]|uniref:Protein ABIL3 isoform X2 n=1 Tax=Raphanus sativus TaxID=3726 RepID=A0A6J0N1U4_RAPSA|nr:protein ABIL3 isoform X2 [Raphanus sativus]XP_018478385.1 protein ABIL3 isoform X2 [Raphanus sativus]KAJ4900471.1 Protein ABIL3 [Raphanus sativus]